MQGENLNYREGAVLLRARRAVGLDKQQAAELFGVDWSLYSRWENGTILPPMTSEWPEVLWDAVMEQIGE